MSWTRGPWQRCTHLREEPCPCGGKGPRGFIYSPSADMSICFVDERDRGLELGADMTQQPSRAETLANAALIAAAPALYEACDAAIRYLEFAQIHRCKTVPDGCEPCKMQAVLRTALATARGETP